MSDNDHRKTIGEWLSMPREWRIPVYQRHYAWNPEETFGPTQLFWEIVEEQATKRLRKKTVDPHYFGAILVEEKSDVRVGIQKYDVVDGQQRLTTINVAMFALIRVAGKFDYRTEVQNKLAPYIFNDSSSENRQQKLVPTNFDRTQFGNLLSFAYDKSRPQYQGDSKQTRQSKVVQACNFFSEEFKEFIDRENSTDATVTIDALIDTITNGFDLVLIQLKQTDEAQKVFESLNNTARPLTTFDLIRNNIFYRADKELSGSDEKLFDSDPWQQFENPFWENTPGRSDNDTHVEAYIARMLMAKKQQLLLLNRNAIFKEYKEFADDQAANGLSVQAEIETISEYVDIYKYLVGEHKENPLGADFRFGYFMHKICNSMDFYPPIFTIATCNSPIEEKQRMISLLESHVIRRSICNFTSEAYNRQAPVICEALGNKPSYEKLEEFLKGSQDSKTRVFPSNKDISIDCLHNNFYKNKLKVYIFDRIVHHTTSEIHDEKRDTRKLTIDHIMPKAWREKNGWKTSLEKFEEQNIDTKIHTIGNLTPMSRGLNAAKSNHDWLGGPKPKGAQLWLKDCDLKLTRKLADKDKWDLDDIDERSKELAKIICEIWPEEIK